MGLKQFIPQQAWTAPTVARQITPPPPAKTVHTTSHIHFNRLLDADDSERTVDQNTDLTHVPIEVSHACQFRHKAHEADVLAEEYKKSNRSLRQQIEKAKLVHNHLYTQLLHRILHREDACSVTLRALCAEKMKKSAK